MRRFACALALFIAFAAFCQAAVLQQETMGTTLEKVREIVRIDGNLSLQKIIPGQNYSTPLTFSWAVPDDSVKGLEGQNITAFVRAKPFASDSWMVFEYNGKKRREASFALNCIVYRGSCGPDSLLSKKITAIINVPPTASGPHPEALVVEAAFTPFPPSEEELAEQEATEAVSTAEKALAEANKTAYNKSLLDNAETLLAVARELVADGSFNASLSLVSSANEAIEKSLATPTPVPTPTPEPTATPAPSMFSGWFSGRNLPYIAGLVLVAVLVVALLFTRRTQGGVDFDKAFDEGEGGLLAKKGGGSDLRALNRDEGDRAYAFDSNEPKPGNAGYAPKTTFLDRYKDKKP